MKNVKIFFGISIFLLVIPQFAFCEEEDQKATTVNERFSGSIRNASKTQIDFNETLIEGKMKAPSGFFIQGRQSQSMAQMVKLRSNFRQKLIQSRFGAKTIIK
ncbi:MAG: hypothetical protein R3B45_02280 [Bdellovibrionota bacterium]